MLPMYKANDRTGPAVTSGSCIIFPSSVCSHIEKESTSLYNREGFLFILKNNYVSWKALFDTNSRIFNETISFEEVNTIIIIMIISISMMIRIMNK